MRRTTALLFTLAALPLAGCALKADLTYAPIAADVPHAGSIVALQIVDARPSNRGGGGTGEIGVVRGGAGNKTPVYADDPAAIVPLARSATEDALHLSHIGLRDGASRTLVATLTDFWVDGFIGYTATVSIDYQLQNERGDVLWSSSASGSADAFPWPSATGFMPAAFQQALASYARKASAQFDAQEFRAALGDVLPPPPSQPAPGSVPAAPSDGLADRLRALQQMRDRGTITNQEYEYYRKQLLDRELLQ